MLLPTLPPALKHLPITPVIRPFSLLLTPHILTLIAIAIRPHKNAITMH